MSEETPAPKPEPKVTPGPAKTIPYERYQSVVAEKKTLSEEVASLKAEVTSLTERAATADTLSATIAELKAAHKGERDAWGEERALIGAGVTDPEGQEVARLLYRRMPDADRPKTIADYITGLHAEGAAVPKALEPYIKPAATRTDERPPPPRTPGNGGRPPPSGDALSADQIRAMRAEAMRTGDWSRVREAMPAIDAAIGAKRRA